jgi:SAM-dependent methyltransferase
MRVLDAGSGAGRNLVYFLRSGYEVFGVDESEEAIAETRRLAAALAPKLPAENFRVEPVERLAADYADYTATQRRKLPAFISWHSGAPSVRNCPVPLRPGSAGLLEP